MFHISYEAGILEDPSNSPPHDMWTMTDSLSDASAGGSELVTLVFRGGIPVELCFEDGRMSITDQLEIFSTLNSLGRRHGIGRIDIVENRFIGIKSRG
jgi:argininosuccinate synthase